VKFAYENDVPFLAYNGHHGTLTTLGDMDYGIQIYLPQLNSLSISADRTLATMGGGINSKSVTDGLWAAGKQTGKWSTRSNLLWNLTKDNGSHWYL
jgi:hypothetical protein